jgi:antitoxin component YwqK of YwqJK toxin-antitoxin module
MELCITNTNIKTNDCEIRYTNFIDTNILCNGSIYKNGIKIYEGEIINKLPNGYGFYFDENGNLYSEGYFQNGLLHGKCIEYFPDYNTYHFRGNYKNGLLNGYGTEYSHNSVIYNGNWKNGLRHGYGIEYFSQEGTKHACILYKGDWKNGLKHGQGTEYYQNGLISYVGYWCNGLYDGYGIKYNNDDIAIEDYDKDILFDGMQGYIYSEIQSMNIDKQKHGVKYFEGIWINGNKFN